MSDFEGPLVEAAQRYLKEHYGEDTVSMTVTHNGVEGGNGVLSVDCTARIGGATSDWRWPGFFPPSRKAWRRRSSTRCAGPRSSSAGMAARDRGCRWSWNCSRPESNVLRLDGVAQNPWSSQEVRFDLYYQYRFQDVEMEVLLAGPPVRGPRLLAQVNRFLARDVCSDTQHRAR